MIDRPVCLFCSAYNMPSFEAGAQLLSSLSGYAYTKRTWKKEVFELFMDPLFFTMDASCASKLVLLLIKKKLEMIMLIPGCSGFNSLSQMLC